MRVHFYGRLADAFGTETEVEISEPCSIAQVRERLAIKYPRDAELLGNRRVRACVDDSIVPDGHLVQPDESIDFIPPVSGG